MLMRKKLLILFIVIAVTPLVLATAASSYLSNSVITETVHENNQKVAISLAREVTEIVDSKIKVLTVLANTAELQSMDPFKQLDLLKRIGAKYPDMYFIIADTQGNQTARSVPGVVASISDREYFKQVRAGATISISDVLVAKGTGKTSITIAVPIKDTKNNVFLGVLAGVVDLKILSQDVGETKIGTSGFAFMVDRNGKLIAHPDPNMVQQMADFSQLEPVKKVMSGETGIAQYAIDGSEKLAGYSSIPVTGWGIIAQQPLKEALAGAEKVRYTGIGFTLVAAFIAIIAGIFAASMIVTPIKKLVLAIEKIASGDLTTQITINSRDELGQLAASFNAMGIRLQGLIKSVVGTANHLAASSQEFAATSGEAERSMNEIAATLTTVAQGSQQQTQEMEKTQHSVAHLTKVANSMSQKATSAQGLSLEMASAAKEGQKAVLEATDKMNEIQEITSTTAEVVASLGEKNAQIDNIIDVINQIAGQTNLLALNAAIEAARAGEAGRGFAVVAEEVRKLAEQSQGAAEKISSIIKQIQTQTEEAILVMQSNRSKVDDGVAVVAVSGQALKNILDKIEKSVTMISEINTATESQLQNTQNMADSVEKVAGIAKVSGENVQTTAAAGEEVSASIEEISKAAESLAKSAEELQSLVSTFII